MVRQVSVRGGPVMLGSVDRDARSTLLNFITTNVSAEATFIRISA